MDYKQLTTLDSKTIRLGIKEYFQNSKDLFETGELLAQNKKYGQAISLTVLSIEELVKAFACSMFFVGEKTEKNIDAAFKGSLDSYRSVHQSRLKFASGINFVLAKIDSKEITKKLIQLVQEKNLEPKSPFISKEEGLTWLQNVIQEIQADDFSVEHFGLTEQAIEGLEDSLKNSDNWFLQAKNDKEKGIYVDYINNKWHSPYHMNEEDYIKAKNHASNTFIKLSEIIEEIISGDEEQSEFVRMFVGALLNRTPLTKV